MRSMYAGVSGLKAHQTKMDVIGNNISNVNTVGYKGSRVTFKEMLSQTLKGASSPQNGRGGTNPQQVGLGVALGSIDTSMEQGNLQSTGKMTDVSIQGEGFFMVNDGKQNVYTRAGSLSFDEDGFLVNSSNGYRIQGWKAAEDGTISKTNAENIEDITLDETMDASATTNINYTGNLNAAAENTLTASPSKIQIEDGTSGATDNVSVSLNKTENFNQWKFSLSAENSSSNITNGTGYITLDEAGKILGINTAKDGSGTDLTIAGNEPTIDIGGTGDTVALDLPSVSDSLSSTPLFKGAEAAGETVEGDYTLNAKRTITTDVYDSQGTLHTIDLTAKKVGDNTWEIENNDVDVSDATMSTASWLSNSPHTINFDADGNVVGGGTVDLTFDPNGGAADGQAVALDFSNFTQFAGDMTADFDTSDGYGQGDLKSFTIDGSGAITGSYDNGYNKTLAKIGIASFSNPAGMSREGDTLFSVSNNSGDPQIGLAGTGGRGMIAPGTLEMSNVDLAQQFTEMITAQRGFQSNSKIISTSDEMLQTLVNLKR